MRSVPKLFVCRVSISQTSFHQIHNYKLDLADKVEKKHLQNIVYRTLGNFLQKISHFSETDVSSVILIGFIEQVPCYEPYAELLLSYNFILRSQDNLLLVMLDSSDYSNAVLQLAS